MLTEFKNSIPLSSQGFGLSLNHYVSGRIAAAVAGHGGLTSVSYHGRQSHKKSLFFRASEVSGFGKLNRMQVLIDDDPYYLEFERTEHYPFGYRSECRLNGVHLQHDLILDQNTLFQRVKVLSNPENSSVRARLLLHGHLLVDAEGRDVGDITNDHFGHFHLKVTDSDGQQLVLNEISIGASMPVQSDSRHGRFKNYMETTEASEEMIFYLAFNQEPEASECAMRMNRQIQSYEQSICDGLRFDTGNPALDSALGNCAPTVCSLALADRPGAIKASQSYWIWGWDSMVHAEAYLWSGHTNIVRDMLDFYHETADSEKGVAHALDSDFNLHLAMAPSAQCLYVVMLHNYYAATGDEATLAHHLPFAKSIIEQAGEARSKHNSLSTGLGFYPDFPQLLGQTENDISLINNSLYFQALCSMQALCGDQYQGGSEAVRSDMERVLWDDERGYWIDSVGEVDLKPRCYYPLYGQLYVSPFGAEPRADDCLRISLFMRRHYRFERGLYMYPPSMPGFMADGNQLGAYYPSVDRYYWNIMNRSDESAAVDEFEQIVTSFWAEHTYPEGLTHETVNADPATDNPGGKQAFAAKSWLCDAIELNLGLRVYVDGFSLKPLSDSRTFRLYNLTLRGKRIDFQRIPSATEAKLVLNGQVAESHFITWDQLNEDDNRIRIYVKI